jgi:uncharacterized RDD family membrane protein YckC
MAVRQLRYCTHCGMPLLAAGNFCQSCGYPLHGDRGAPHRRPYLVPPPPGTNLSRAPTKRRLAAGAADLVIAGAAALLAWALGAETSVILAGGVHAGRGGGHGLLAWVAAAAVLGGYQPFFWWVRGATPGMQLFGLRLVRADGSPAGLRRSVVRAGAMVLSIGALGAGFLAARRDPSARTWHDRLAGTVVTTPPPP